MRALVIIAASILAATTAPTAMAGNWGSGVPGHEWKRCLEDNPSTHCTADNGSHYVYVDAAIPTALDSAIDASLDELEAISGITTTYQTSITSNTDVRVRWGGVEAGEVWVYTTCQGNASYGGGGGEYRHCKKQQIRIDPYANRTDQCLADAGCLRWLTCHELGHTLGLMHTPLDRVSCMNYDEDNEDLDLHDKNHLVDCYEKPQPAPDFRTNACAVYEGGGYGG